MRGNVLSIAVEFSFDETSPYRSSRVLSAMVITPVDGLEAVARDFSKYLKPRAMETRKARQLTNALFRR
jgi:hypothetical protein